MASLMNSLLGVRTDSSLIRQTEDIIPTVKKEWSIIN
jgi:hypothetical protein